MLGVVGQVEGHVVAAATSRFANSTMRRIPPKRCRCGSTKPRRRPRPGLGITQPRLLVPRDCRLQAPREAFRRRGKVGGHRMGGAVATGSEARPTTPARRVALPPAARRAARGRGVPRRRVPRRDPRLLGRLHRRRRVLRALGLPRHPAAAARPPRGGPHRLPPFLLPAIPALAPGRVRRRSSSPRSCTPRSRRRST